MCSLNRKIDFNIKNVALVVTAAPLIHGWVTRLEWFEEKVKQKTSVLTHLRMTRNRTFIIVTAAVEEVSVNETTVDNL